jgi:EmrB/QacA subfamily drug resistance transporter
MSAEPGSRRPGSAASSGPDAAAGERPAAGAHPRSPGRGNTTVIFVTLALGASAYTVLQSLVLPALPVIQHDLHTSQATVSWLLTAFLLSASIATPILGRIGDLFGKQRMLLVVFAALSIGSLISGLTDSIGLLILARVIQGLAGGIFPLAFGIIRDEFPPAKVPAAIGLMSGMLGIGSGLGVVLAGPIVEGLGWHWLFWFPLMVSGLSLIATIFFIPESPVRATGSVNLPAAGALAAWLVALLLGLSKGSTWGWASGGTIGLFAAAVALFAVWVLVESRSAVPLIDLQVMRIPAVWWTNAAALLLGIGMYATFIVVPPLMQTPKSVGYGLGASVTLSGLYMLPGTVAMLVLGVLIGRITDRFGSKLPLVVGSVVAAAACALLVVDHGSPWNFIVMSGVQGIGIGLAFSSMANLIIQSVPIETTGAATGMNANIRTIGGSIGSGIVASVLASGGLPGGYPKESSYVTSLVLLGVATLVAALASALVPTIRAARSGRAGGTTSSPVPAGAAGEAVTASAAS